MNLLSVVQQSQCLGLVILVLLTFILSHVQCEHRTSVSSHQSNNRNKKSRISTSNSTIDNCAGSSSRRNCQQQQQQQDQKKRSEKGKKRRGNNGKQPRQDTIDQDSRPRRHRHADLSLWIDEQQVKLFSGLLLEIYVITDGHVQPYILDPKFEQYLPVIPSEVGVVNFTWRAGDRKYFYHFDRLQSVNEDILLDPVVSIDTRGRIPRKPKGKGKPLAGTPLRLRLRKECAEQKPLEPDPECDKKCANGGWCNKERGCHCPEGYMGPYCQLALCYPQCMNGGSCIAPGVCNCQHGFHGLHCEGGICSEKCLNGGKCVQKDTCDCTKGYYGLRCEYSKCMIPCLNGGRCRGVNLCRCPPNFSGDHCEIGLHPLNNRTLTQRHICSLPCRHGNCIGPNLCECYEGFYGKRCQRRNQL